MKKLIKKHIEKLYSERDAWANEEPYYLKGSSILNLRIKILSFKIALWESLL
jgi:hypothetical protein